MMSTTTMTMRKKKTASADFKFQASKVGGFVDDAAVLSGSDDYGDDNDSNEEYEDENAPY